jgi:omega-amidase
LSSQPALPALRVAIAQTPMQWTTEANVAVIERAMALAAARGASICVFSELAVAGFQALCKAQRMACGVGAPSFGAGGAVYNSYLHIDEHGALVGQVDKTGLTVAEATFFHGGRGRPVSVLQGRRASAVLCREVEDTALVLHHLPAGSVDLIFLPGLLGRAPEGEVGADIAALSQQLARSANAWLLQCNWPQALNLPVDSPFQADLGGSRVHSPAGDLMLRLPMQAAGVATFDLGATEFAWDALANPAAAG